MSFTANVKVPLLPSSPTSSSKLCSTPKTEAFSENSSLYQVLEERVSYLSCVSLGSGSDLHTVDPKNLSSSSSNYTFFKPSYLQTSDTSVIIEPSAMFGFSHYHSGEDHSKVESWNVPRTPAVDQFPIKNIFNHNEAKRSASLAGLNSLIELKERDIKRRKSESSLFTEKFSSAVSILGPSTSVQSPEEASETTFEFHFDESMTAPLLDFLEEDDSDSGTETEQDDGPSTPEPNQHSYTTPDMSDSEGSQQKPSETIMLLFDPMSGFEKSLNAQPASQQGEDDDEEEDYTDTEFKPKFEAPPMVVRSHYLSTSYTAADTDTEFEGDRTDSEHVVKLTSMSKVQHEKAIIEQVQIKVVPPVLTPPATSSSSTSGTSSDSKASPASISSPTQRLRSSRASKRFKQTSRSGAKQNKQFRPLEPGEVYYPCPKCDQFFRRPEHVKRHIRSVHTLVRPYKCEFCEKRFPRSDNLSQHLKTHMSIEEWNRLKDGSCKAKLIKTIKKRLGVK